jgi:hypothetical protein
LRTERRHQRLQLARLDPALRLAAEQVSAGNISAIDRLIRVLSQIDKYQHVMATIGEIEEEKIEDEDELGVATIEEGPELSMEAIDAELERMDRMWPIEQPLGRIDRRAPIEQRPDYRAIVLAKLEMGAENRAAHARDGALNSGQGEAGQNSVEDSAASEGERGDR